MLSASIIANSLQNGRSVWAPTPRRGFCVSIGGRFYFTRISEKNPRMVDFNLINSLGDLESEVDNVVATALGVAAEDLNQLVKHDEVQDFRPGAIIKSRVGSVVGDDFVVELGLKSEGVLERNEFDEP